MPNPPQGFDHNPYAPPFAEGLHGEYVGGYWFEFSRTTAAGVRVTHRTRIQSTMIEQAQYLLREYLGNRSYEVRFIGVEKVPPSQWHPFWLQVFAEQLALEAE